MVEAPDASKQEQLSQHLVQHDENCRIYKRRYGIW